MAITVGIPDNGKELDVVAALGAIAAYGIVVFLLDRGDLRAIAAQVVARLGGNRPGSARGKRRAGR